MTKREIKLITVALESLKTDQIDTMDFISIIENIVAKQRKLNKK